MARRGAHAGHDHDAPDELYSIDDQEVRFTQNKARFGPTVDDGADFPLGQERPP